MHTNTHTGTGADRLLCLNQKQMRLCSALCFLKVPKIGWIWQSIHWNKQECRSSTLCHETGSSVLTAVSLSSVCRIPDKCSVISYCVLFFVHSVISIQEKFLKRIFACKIFFIVIRLLNKIQLWCSSGSFMMFHDYLENCNQEALRVFLLTLHFKAIRFTINFCKLSLF